MTRPALVIGLGGTGQWALTYLKKDLMESNNGQMPSTVRLLCFDTLPQAGAEVAAAALNRRGEQEVKVGSVQLEKNTEFIHLGGNVYEISELVCEDSKKPDERDRRLPHIASWFQACHWLSTLPRAAFVLSAGAGMLRQFGRVALFKDLSSSIQSEVWQRLDSAIGYLSTQLQGEQRLEIIIIGSFAGGTGSGLFLDLALLARHRARHVPILLRGYFVLPRAFDADATDDMLARSFAAWRELNRFMSISNDFPLPNVLYNARESQLQVREVKTKAFDACYLVDGVRNGARVAAAVELGVHPTIADAVSAILDDEAGNKYTEWVVQNLAPTYATMPGTPLYSIVGTRTFKVPVYYAQQDFTHRFTVNWLDELLKPLHGDPNNKDLVTGVDPTSPNNPAAIGRQEALTLLTSPQEFGNVAENPTRFFGAVAEVIGAGSTTDPALVQSFAKGTAGGKSWLEPFTTLGDRQDMVDTVTKVKQEAGLRVDNFIKTSKLLKEPTADFAKRFDRQFSGWFQQHYGFQSVHGQEDRGLFGKVLDECAQAQLTIFARQMQLWLLKTLNGGDKRGRLGYAYDFMYGLVGYLDDMIRPSDGFMDRVRAQRQEERPLLKQQQARDGARRTLQAMAGKHWPSVLPLWDDPKVDVTQVAYLKAEQAVVDARKDELLHDTVARTIQSMREYAAAVRAELERWIRLLATGDPATKVEGLYSVLERQRREMERTRQADERLTAVQTRLPAPEYPKPRESEELQRLMAGIAWSIRTDNSGLHLDLQIKPTDEVGASLQLPTGQERADAQQRLTQRNLGAMEGFAERRFGQLPEETRVAERLRAIYAPSDLSAEIGKSAAPLFDEQPGTQGGPARISQLLRISLQGVDPATETFIRGKMDADGKVLESGVVQELRATQGKDPNKTDVKKLIEAVGSADTHKATVVCTHDLIPAEFFRAWHECKDAYLRNRQMPPQLNHLYPAEANAARYELMLADKRKRTYQVFHPWVVMLLEHPDRLEQYFLAWCNDWIQVQNDGALSWYELSVPGFERPFMLTPASTTLYSVFQAARFFVLEGTDQRSQSAWVLDYDEIRTALQDAERTAGAEDWMAFLREQITPTDPNDERMIVPMLQKQVKKLDGLKKLGKEWPSGEPSEYRKAYADLADVAQLMLEERLGRKEVQVAQKSRTRSNAPIRPES